MRNVTDRTRNPFDMRPSCDRYVPGYGDANADFHVIGDHPGVHGGIETGVPFAGGAGEKLFPALEDGELLGEAGDEPTVNSTFFSYLHMCVPDGTPSAADYTDMERFFDAELRAIAAHVLLPVGAVATKYVLNNYTSVGWKTDIDMEALHGEELRGSGFLVLPIKDPAEWDDGDHDELVAGLLELQSTDFRRESDLGRFMPGADPYLVR
ncbi:uracil-DNA glycosylase family protein [Haloferax volcanii]|uniref:Uracil-DNA glycosylase superfamily protein n=3 Tax=Haloferax volcanii TaxID=2246 RepID=D4GVL4_HALVD|nr:uracil-DNA glycosylase family protein [Haloferax volcanii]ADE05018.1 uracil-DNA glycosylase superfamily protein [Haloferax volcanii DS2]ELY27576.1 uracil DNA glycosylase [Haloferax volcanii DS2]MBS8119622.1 uracil-DNA glycosylase [Haloferax volcanii]MBS8124634.1 uracil-DNA glycosylase [Haloferax volcanii]MBS8128697.1 uracil-DNA glycosylase [Haloferax volcanii]